MVHAVVVLLLIGAANTAPLVARFLLGNRFAWPVDGGLPFFDGQPLLGHSKTVRGIVVGALVPALLAPLFGHPWWQGLWIGAVAMAGDLLSSFCKRRLKRPPSSQALGLDQIPESLLPALLATAWFGLSTGDVIAIVSGFVVLELVLSKVLFRFNLRDRPY